jgi:phosphatidylserine decarboxylase
MISKSPVIRVVWLIAVVFGLGAGPLAQSAGAVTPGGDAPVDADTMKRVAASPCSGSLSYLIGEFVANPIVPAALDAVAAGVQDLPQGYAGGNPWKQAADGRQLLNLMVDHFIDWCVFLPQINGTNDNGLEYIQEFAWFYFRNPAGQHFVQGRNPLEPGQPLPTGLKFTMDFSKERGAFMDSPASRTHIGQWIGDPRIEIEDYQKQKADQYGSWNEFFARQITIDTQNETIPSRPATMPLSEYPERDYIVVAPTDCIMNPLVQIIAGDGTVERRFVENPLQYDTVLDVKGIPISVGALLSGVADKYRERFVGGTGLACVLMPNTYHHFHAPVNGTIVHAAVVPDGTYGYLDWPNWVPLDGNVGRPGTDFSQFQVFQRGVIIIEVKYADLDGTELTGYVASVPVGLDTIGSVVLDDDIVPGKVVKRGYTRLGNFFYGGSLDILLFSKGLASGVIQTRLGNQITLFNVGTPPASQ